MTARGVRREPRRHGSANPERSNAAGRVGWNPELGGADFSVAAAKQLLVQLIGNVLCCAAILDGFELSTVG